MTLHSSSACPGQIERTEYIPLFVDPERCSSRAGGDAERLNHHLSRSDFCLESHPCALGKNRVCFDRNYPISLGKVIRGIIAVVHTHVKNGTGCGFCLRTDIGFRQKRENFWRVTKRTARHWYLQTNWVLQGRIPLWA